MDPRDFLELAKKLVTNRNAEAAHYRSAIGRAYYAAFNVTAELIHGLGCSLPKTAEAHTRIVQLLQNSGDQELEGIGGRLGDLRAVRNRADYNMEPHHSVDRAVNARTHVETANDIIKEINHFLNDDSRIDIAGPRIRSQYALLMKGTKSGGPRS